MAIASISPAEVHARMARGETVDLIDVRTAVEWAGGRAAGAIHAPLGGLDPAAVMAARRGRPEDPLYIICASGGRSLAACEAFHQAGFTQAVNVSGGTSAWRRAGLPVEGGLPPAVGGTLRRVGLAVAGVAVALLITPCSPLSLWGAAWCPTAAAAEAGAAAEVDFAREVVAASASVPVLVDFHAGWCPPCRKLGPEVAALAQERGERLRVVKIDVDRQGALAQAHGVSGIPDLRLWHAGKEVARSSGFRPREELAAWIDQSLGKP